MSASTRQRITFDIVIFDIAYLNFFIEKRPLPNMIFIIGNAWVGE